MSRAKKKLTAKQARFKDEYLVDMNATKAAIRAGYSEKTAYSQGQRLLKNVDLATSIQKAIKKRSDRTQVTQDRVLEEFAKIGFSDMKNFVDFGPGGITIKDLSALPQDAAACVSEVTEINGVNGRSMKFKLHDKLGALNSLARHLGMFTDKLDLSGSIEAKGAIVNVTITADA